MARENPPWVLPAHEPRISVPEWMAESLDYVIPLNERHLRRLIRDYVGYYHLDRTHDAVGKDAPRSTSH